MGPCPLSDVLPLVPLSRVLPHDDNIEGGGLGGASVVELDSQSRRLGAGVLVSHASAVILRCKENG